MYFPLGRRSNTRAIFNVYYFYIKIECLLSTGFSERRNVLNKLVGRKQIQSVYKHAQTHQHTHTQSFIYWPNYDTSENLKEAEDG